MTVVVSFIRKAHTTLNLPLKDPSCSGGPHSLSSRDLLSALGKQNGSIWPLPPSLRSWNLELLAGGQWADMGDDLGFRPGTEHMDNWPPWGRMNRTCPSCPWPLSGCPVHTAMDTSPLLSLPIPVCPGCALDTWPESVIYWKLVSVGWGREGWEMETFSAVSKGGTLVLN